mgnify:FL=1
MKEQVTNWFSGRQCRPMEPGVYQTTPDPGADPEKLVVLWRRWLGDDRGWTKHHRERDAAAADDVPYALPPEFFRGLAVLPC